MPDIRLAAERRALYDLRSYANQHPDGPGFTVQHSEFVYFAQATDDPQRLIKIGVSRNPLKRRMELQGDYRKYFGRNSRIHILAAFPGNNQAERYAHAAFREFCFSGEWFLPADPIISVVDEILRSARGVNQ